MGRGRGVGVGMEVNRGSLEGVYGLHVRGYDMICSRRQLEHIQDPTESLTIV